MNYTAERYHDISAGHRVVDHESKCRHIHGHNYRIHFVCAAASEGPHQLDDLGRVIDFGVIKERLCQWVENNWDHKFLMWENDPVLELFRSDPDVREAVRHDIEIVPFNPTAENMAAHLVNFVGPAQLSGTGVILKTVRIEETRKCAATYTRHDV